MAEKGKELFSGVLYKVGGKIKSWTKRYFILKSDSSLYYYKDINKDPVGSILLHDAAFKARKGTPGEISWPKQAKHDCRMAIETVGRTYYTYCEYSHEIDEWISILNNAAQNATQKKRNSSLSTKRSASQSALPSNLNKSSHMDSSRPLSTGELPSPLDYEAVYEAPLKENSTDAANSPQGNDIESIYALVAAETAQEVFTHKHVTSPAPQTPSPSQNQAPLGGGHHNNTFPAEQAAIYEDIEVEHNLEEKLATTDCINEKDNIPSQSDLPPLPARNPPPPLSHTSGRVLESFTDVAAGAPLDTTVDAHKKTQEFYDEDISSPTTHVPPTAFDCGSQWPVTSDQLYEDLDQQNEQVLYEDISTAHRHSSNEDNTEKYCAEEKIELTPFLPPLPPRNDLPPLPPKEGDSESLPPDEMIAPCTSPAAIHDSPETSEHPASSSEENIRNFKAAPVPVPVPRKRTSSIARQEQLDSLHSTSHVMQQQPQHPQCITTAEDSQSPPLSGEGMNLYTAQKQRLEELDVKTERRVTLVNQMLDVIKSNSTFNPTQTAVIEETMREVEQERLLAHEEKFRWERERKKLEEERMEFERQKRLMEEKLSQMKI